MFWEDRGHKGAPYQLFSYIPGGGLILFQPIKKEMAEIEETPLEPQEPLGNSEENAIEIQENPEEIKPAPKKKRQAPRCKVKA